MTTTVVRASLAMDLPFPMWTDFIWPSVGIFSIIDYQTNTVCKRWHQLLVVTSTIRASSSSSITSMDRMWQQAAMQLTYPILLNSRSWKIPAGIDEAKATTAPTTSTVKVENKADIELIPYSSNSIERLQRLCDTSIQRDLTAASSAAASASGSKVTATKAKTTTNVSKWRQRAMARASLLSRWRQSFTIPCGDVKLAQTTQSIIRLTTATTTGGSGRRFPVRRAFEAMEQAEFGNFTLTNDGTRLAYVHGNTFTEAATKIVIHKNIMNDDDYSIRTKKTIITVPEVAPDEFGQSHSNGTTNFAPFSTRSEMMCIATPDRIMTLNTNTGTTRHVKVPLMLHQRHVAVCDGNSSQPVAYIADPSTIEVDLSTLSITRHQNLSSSACAITTCSDDDGDPNILTISWREGIQLADRRQSGAKQSIYYRTGPAFMNPRQHGHMLMTGGASCLSVLYDLRKGLSRPLWISPMLPEHARGMMAKFTFGLHDFNIRTGLSLLSPFCLSQSPISHPSMYAVYRNDRNSYRS
jgi:hypothetical protein